MSHDNSMKDLSQLGTCTLPTDRLTTHSTSSPHRARPSCVNWTPLTVDAADLEQYRRPLGATATGVTMDDATNGVCESSLPGHVHATHPEQESCINWKSLSAFGSGTATPPSAIVGPSSTIGEAERTAVALLSKLLRKGDLVTNAARIMRDTMDIILRAPGQVPQTDVDHVTTQLGLLDEMRDDIVREFLVTLNQCVELSRTIVPLSPEAKADLKARITAGALLFRSEDN